MFHILNVCLYLSLMIITAACSAKRVEGDRPSVGNMPEWVRHTPKINKMICAVGVSEPTYFKDDGKKYAADAARVELSHVLNTKIESIMVDIQESRGAFVDRAAVTEVSSWASDAVLTGAQISEYWYDEGGSAFARQKGVTYALACMSLDAQVSEFTERLKKVFPGDSEGVVERTEKAFEELEKTEKNDKNILRN